MQNIQVPGNRSRAFSKSKVRAKKLSYGKKPHLIDKLCTQCGICCNGDLFKDVELRETDDPLKLVALGLTIPARGRSATVNTTNPKSRIQNPKFQQPCTAFTNCKCSIYPDRPAHCREFECALLKATAAGKIEIPVAIEIIQRTRKRADSIRQLMERLGESRENQCLNIRFRRVRRSLEESPISKENASRFSRLARSVHALNLILGKYFYPGSAMQSLSRRTHLERNP